MSVAAVVPEILTIEFVPLQYFGDEKNDVTGRKSKIPFLQNLDFTFI